MQINRDLCTVARAEHSTSGKDLAVIREIAADLSAPNHFVGQAMAIETQLD